MAIRQSTTRTFSYVGAEGFGGGLHSENPITIPSNGMVVADNVLIGTVQTRRKRGGQEKYHTGSLDQTASYPASGTAIRGFIEYWRTASVSGVPTSDIFLHQSTKVWSLDDRNTIGVDRTGSLTIATDGVPCYQPFNQWLYYTSTNTADGYNKWTGSGASVTANPPADGPGAYICTHLGRMIMAGNRNFPFRVYFSAALDPETWTTIGGGTSLDLDADGDPEGINGIVSFQNRLYVGTRKSIYEITGTTVNTFVVLKVSSGIGFLNHASIAQVPNDVIFASDRGVHSLRQTNSGRQTETAFLSRDIQRLWTEQINFTYTRRIKAHYAQDINCYLVTITAGSATTHSDVLAYNIEYGTWTNWKGVTARWIGSALLNNKSEVMIAREDGRLAFLNTNTRTDLDVSYPYRWRSGVLYPGGYQSNKRFTNITLLASSDRPTNVVIQWDIDGKKTGTKAFTLQSPDHVLGSTFILGTSRLAINQYVPTTIGIEDHGYGIQIEVQTGGDADIEVYGFILEVEDVNPNYS